MKPVASNDLVSRVKYEWAKTYKTNIPEARLRKELGPLGNETPSSVAKSLAAYMASTPPQFFSWTKWRDTWNFYGVSSQSEIISSSPGDLFAKLLTSSSGYSPSIGTYWLIKDIRDKLGDRVANALIKIGGVGRLANMASDQKKWIEREFINAYNKP